MQFCFQSVRDTRHRSRLACRIGIPRRTAPSYAARLFVIRPCSRASHAPFAQTAGLPALIRSRPERRHDLFAERPDDAAADDAAVPAGGAADDDRFTRIIIVLSILRQAIGAGNAAESGAARPGSVSDAVRDVAGDRQSGTDGHAVCRARSMVRHSSAASRRSRPSCWGRRARAISRPSFALSGGDSSPQDVPLTMLAPAFVTSELKTAFQIGFMLFIPFLIIDLVVASVLMSMGMMMLSPAPISLPFKLMLFVLVDGWQLLIGSLAQSFFTRLMQRLAPSHDSRNRHDDGAAGDVCRPAAGRSAAAGRTVVGLVVSLFQAATQINEMTLSFIPKLLAIAHAGDRRSVDADACSTTCVTRSPDSDARPLSGASTLPAPHPPCFRSPTHNSTSG